MEWGALKPICQVHYCGKKDSGVPPRATEQLSKSQQLSSTLSLSSYHLTTKSRVSVSCPHGENGPGRWGGWEPPWPWSPLPAPACAVCPFPGDVLSSHGQSSAHSADRCCFPSGLSDRLCQILCTPMCFFVPVVTRRAFSTTPFSEREPRLASAGNGVSCYPSQLLNHLSFYLLTLLSLTLGLY